jgi:hypothetical protein
VDLGPGHERERERLPLAKLTGLLALDDALDQEAEGGTALLAQPFVVCGLGEVRPEHDAEVGGVVDSEEDVGDPTGEQALGGAGFLVHALAHLRGHGAKPLLRHGGQQGLLVGEVPVGSSVGDTGPAGDLAQGERAEALLGDEGQGRLDKGAAQVSMVVAGLRLRARLLPGGHEVVPPASEEGNTGAPESNHCQLIGMRSSVHPSRGRFSSTRSPAKPKPSLPEVRGIALRLGINWRRTASCQRRADASTLLASPPKPPSRGSRRPNRPTSPAPHTALRTPSSGLSASDNEPAARI